MLLSTPYVKPQPAERASLTLNQSAVKKGGMINTTQNLQDGQTPEEKNFNHISPVHEESPAISDMTRTYSQTCDMDVAVTDGDKSVTTNIDSKRPSVAINNNI